jgi:hypothetical protein
MWRAARHIAGPERGGWRLFGRLLIWATRNNVTGGDEP